MVDRIKDLILNGGFNVYPRMVEEAILLHPAVAEATVCGVPDRHRGEVVKAYVRLAEGASLEVAELRAFLKDKLAPFEQPKHIELRAELPLSWLGKPSKRALVAEELRRLNAQPLAPPIEAQPVDGLRDGLPVGDSDQWPAGEWPADRWSAAGRRRRRRRRGRSRAGFLSCPDGRLVGSRAAGACQAHRAGAGRRADMT